MDIKKIRAQFPALERRFGGKRLIYFDNACSVLKPRTVIKAVSHYLSALGSCAGGRSGHMLSAMTEELCDEVRRKTAVFLNASSPSEIIFTGNTTAGVNLVARTFPFTGHKNEVVLTAFDHHSSMLPFLEEQKKGNIRVRIAGLGKGTEGKAQRGRHRGWELDADEICSLITDRTALVCLPAVSNVTGQFFPVKEVAAGAHRRGALVFVDAAQSLSSSREDVRASGIDMLAFSGHKLGAPPGIGALYCRKDVMSKLKNFDVGGGTVSDVFLNAAGQPTPVYFEDYRRFEAGIQNYAGIAGLGAAIDFLRSGNNIGAQAGRVAAFCRRKLAAMDKVELLGPGSGAGPLAPIISFVFRNNKISAHDFNIFLNNELPRHIVCVRCGNHCAIPLHRTHGLKQSLRLSFFVYNTEREAGIFTSALENYLNET